ncbi:unnamed protein product [Rodentolepis nana]|uniref:Uncharacterized protein n=1 Tax=Rodentolepis nana TaxID=102285 RepID=A0A0R3U0W1_RODNA|nr:unnamed protein product [Rodentolepis nana]
MGSASTSGERDSSGWKPLVSSNAVFSRLLDASDLAKPTQQKSTRSKRVVAVKRTSKKPIPTKRPRKRRGHPSGESETSVDESEDDDFIEVETKKSLAPKRPSTGLEPKDSKEVPSAKTSLLRSQRPSEQSESDSEESEHNDFLQ